METFIWKLKMTVLKVLKVLGLKKTTNTEVTVSVREISEDELPPDIKEKLIKKYGHL